MYQQTVQSTTVMTGCWRQCIVLLLLVTGDCAEHSYWLLETVQYYHWYCRQCIVLLVTGECAEH